MSTTTQLTPAEQHIFEIIISLKASWVWKVPLPAREAVCMVTFLLRWYGNVSSMMRGYFKHMRSGGGVGRNSWMAKPYCKVLSLVPNRLLLQKRKIHPSHARLFQWVGLARGITLNSYITCSNKALRIFPSPSDNTSFSASVLGASLQICVAFVRQKYLTGSHINKSKKWNKKARLNRKKKLNNRHQPMKAN